MAQSMINKLPLGIIVFNKSMNISSINFLSKTIIEKGGAGFLSIVKKMAKKTSDNGDPAEKIIKYINADEFYVWKIKAEPISSHSQVMVLIEDITLVHQLEAAVLKAEKLAVVGQLALGSLFEIRNPLTSALGFCRFIEQHNTPKDEYIKIIADELVQIQNIVVNTPGIVDNSQPVNLEMVYKKIWSYLSARVKRYSMLMITDGFEDLAVNVAQEYVNSVLGKLISILNITNEEAVNIIICVELHEDGRHLNLNIKADFTISAGSSQKLQRVFDDLEGRNTQIDIQLIGDHTIVLNSHLPIIISRSDIKSKGQGNVLVKEG
jgi:signal transduction histidine kinase